MNGLKNIVRKWSHQKMLFGTLMNISKCWIAYFITQLTETSPFPGAERQSLFHGSVSLRGIPARCLTGLVVEMRLD